MSNAYTVSSDIMLIWGRKEALVFEYRSKIEFQKVFRENENEALLNPNFLFSVGIFFVNTTQTNIIRTCFRSEMGSDYLFSLTDPKAYASATGKSAGLPPRREIRYNNFRKLKRG